MGKLKWNVEKIKTECENLGIELLSNEYCSKNNIRLLRIPYNKFNNIEEIIDEFLNICNTEITNRSKKILVS